MIVSQVTLIVSVNKDKTSFFLKIYERDNENKKISIFNHMRFPSPSKRIFLFLFLVFHKLTALINNVLLVLLYHVPLPTVIGGFSHFSFKSQRKLPYKMSSSIPEDIQSAMMLIFRLRTL